MLLRFVLLAALAIPLHGGCALFLDLGHPSSAFITVRLFNCWGESREAHGTPYPAEHYTVQATAEGLVNGQRVSVPLVVKRLAIPGLSAVEWEPPSAGVWLVNFVVSDAGPYSVDGNSQTAIGGLAVLRSGKLQPRTQPVRRAARPEEIDATLRSLLRVGE